MHRLAPARRAIAGDGMAGALEASVAADVHVQEIAGAGPLVAVGRLPRRALGPRDARFNTFQTVECAKPVTAATRRGPQPVSRRQAQIRSCSEGASSRGERRGLLERS